MAKESKRYKAIKANVEPQKQYGLREALELCKANATAKFNESVELHVRLGVDPRQADQQVRGTVPLPHGTGVTKRVLVITMGEKLKEAEEAGADFVGSDDMVQKIEGGWLDFDAVVTSPDMMKSVGKLGKILGPRGLMPSAKTGTITFDVADAVKEVKAGRVEFRLDKFGIIHKAVGKTAFTADQLYDNARAFFQAILKAKPSAAKGTYVKSFSVASTMGVGIRVDPNAAQKEIAAVIE